MLKADSRVAAVIVTHKRVDLLRASLDVVANQTRPVEWVIVVDNGCEDAVRNLLNDVAGDRGVYLPSATNLGGAGGFAYGFLQALALGAEAVWCADDDGRAILADRGILLVGHPGPHDLAGIRVAVHHGSVRGVGECVRDVGFADRGLGPIRGRRILVVVVGAGMRGRGRG